MKKFSLSNIMRYKLKAMDNVQNNSKYCEVYCNIIMKNILELFYY